MSKFLVIYERESLFSPFGFSSFVGFEIIEAPRFDTAYRIILEYLKDLKELHKNMRRIHIRILEQVNDDFKPSDAYITSFAEIEEVHRHSEAMAKTKGGEKKD